MLRIVSPVEGRILVSTLRQIGRLAFCAALLLATPAVSAAITIQVTSDGDGDDGNCNSHCTLREAVVLANVTGGKDTIQFQADYTITLGSELQAINQGVILDGSGRDVVINANGNRVVQIEGGAEVDMIGLTVTGGDSLAGTVLLDKSSLLVRDCTFRNNTASTGAGIYVTELSTLVVERSSFFDNTADAYGAAIHSEGGLVVVRNSSFGGNDALGGAVSQSNGATMFLHFSTFSGNSSAVHNLGGNLYMSNDILADSTDFDCLNEGTVQQSDRNLIEDGSPSCYPTWTGDPNLSAAADNGGPTFTFELKAPSAAIDAADDAFCASEIGNIDQRGRMRPFGSHCDLGAYEIGGCGDGLVEGAESCDDGNTASGDCCSSSCQFEAEGAACTADAADCTLDACDGAGHCIATPDHDSCDDGSLCTTDVCVPAEGCVNEAPTCGNVALRSSLKIKDSLQADKRSLQFVWGKSAMADLDLGDPVEGGTMYGLCVFDSEGLVLEMQAGPGSQLCDGRPCWARGSKGFSYKDKLAAFDGITSLSATRDVTRATGTVKLKAKGAGMPAFSLVDRFDTASPIEVMVLTTGAACWQTVFEPGHFLAGDGERLVAKR